MSSQTLRPTGFPLPGRQSWQPEAGWLLDTARKFLETPAERVECRPRWSLTSVSPRLTSGISDLQASSAKVLLAEGFVCKIGMLMRPSSGFFLMPYTLKTSVGRREGRNPLFSRGGKVFLLFWACPSRKTLTAGF